MFRRVVVDFLDECCSNLLASQWCPCVNAARVYSLLVISRVEGCCSRVECARHPRHRASTRLARRGTRKSISRSSREMCHRGRAPLDAVCLQSEHSRLYVIASFELMQADNPANMPQRRACCSRALHRVDLPRNKRHCHDEASTVAISSQHCLRRRPLDARRVGALVTATLASRRTHVASERVTAPLHS